jgi:hypothetical protein
MSKITIFTNNDIYRLGDAIMYNNYSPKLLTCSSYATSFIHKYLVNKNVRNVASLGIMNNTISQNEELILPQRLKIAAITLSELVRDRKLEVPSPDKLVVHLRLGDIITFKDGSEDHSGKKEKYANYDDTVEKIRNSSKKKVVVVTAIHHQSLEGDNDVDVEHLKLSMSSLSSHKGSILLLYRLKDEVTNMGKSVEIRSSRDVDSDFVYLCFSNELVLSGISGFGRAAYEIHSFIIGRDKCIINSQCRQDWVDLAPKILWSLRSTYTNNINS